MIACILTIASAIVKMQAIIRKLDTKLRAEKSTGQVLVVEGLDVPLVSFHAMEAGGYEYVRHPRVPRLREWHRDGKAIPELTFCVYPNNLAVWHRDGAAPTYPKNFPESMGAYRSRNTSPALLGETYVVPEIGQDLVSFSPLRKRCKAGDSPMRETPQQIWRKLTSPSVRGRQGGRYGGFERSA